MGSAFSLVKSLIVPALIALVLYVLTTYLIYPLWRRHHSRYTSYIPVPTSLQNLTTNTNSFRQRLQGALTRMILPSTWRSNAELETYRAHNGHSSQFDEESGEELEEVDEAQRREALSLDARRGRNTSDDRRLSRDLEEGFKDDSEDEESANVIANLEMMGMLTRR